MMFNVMSDGIRCQNCEFFSRPFEDVGEVEFRGGAEADAPARGGGLPQEGLWSREERADVDSDAGDEDRRERSAGQPFLEGVVTALPQK
jgi:hypothetical protein